MTTRRTLSISRPAGLAPSSKPAALPARLPPAAKTGDDVLPASRFGRSAQDAPRTAAPRVAQTLIKTDTTRLNKRMADMGLCSRREADAWIANGWVLVNGEMATTGMQVLESDLIEVAHAAKGQQERRVTILLHKPMGYVSAQAEDGHQPAVVLITAQNRWSEDRVRTQFQPNQLYGLAPAGRLDIDSVGMLVLTQDGRIARQLIGENSDISKEYLVRVIYQSPQGEVTTQVQQAYPAHLLEKLRHGLSLDGKPLKPAEVEWENPEQLRFVLREGKKRQIRRMCEQVGLKVVGLKRIRMGRVVLGRLPVGQWRYLAPHEQF